MIYIVIKSQSVQLLTKPDFFNNKRTNVVQLFSNTIVLRMYINIYKKIIIISYDCVILDALIVRKMIVLDDSETLAQYLHMYIHIILIWLGRSILYGDTLEYANTMDASRLIRLCFVHLCESHSKRYFKRLYEQRIYVQV